MEKDWKTFKKIVPILRERYLKEKNNKIKKLLETEGKSEADRFWEAREEIEKERKILINCLDEHPRSKLIYHMILMYNCGMLKKEDLKDFSDELQKQIINIENN